MIQIKRFHRHAVVGYQDVLRCSHPDPRFKYVAIHGKAKSRRREHTGQFAMNLDAVPILALFAAAVVVVMISIEGGYRLGRIFHRRSKQEKESPVSAVAGAVLALVAFMLAFTFGIAANRFDARKELVREEANNI